MPIISVLLTAATAKGLDRLDAQILLLHALGTAPGKLGSQRAWLLAHDADELPVLAQTRFKHHVRRRLAGEPVAYITGHREFYGLDLHVDARVLVPRPDTESLVSWALELLTGPIPLEFGPPHAVLDLGTGSGAIALALKHSLPDLRVDAIDASADALNVARANARRLRLKVRMSLGNWLDGVRRRYHCIVANPPYVAELDSHLAALAYEPTRALVSGHDGLQDIDRIVTTAVARLHTKAWLLIEHGHDQAAAVRNLFWAAGYHNVTSRRDLGGNERCTGGQVTATMRQTDKPTPDSTR